MAEYTPTTKDVREGFTLQAYNTTGMLETHAAAGAAFDRWLAQHDAEVRVKYEERRKPDPIHVDNIDGQNATQWLAQHDAETIAGLRLAVANLLALPAINTTEAVNGVISALAAIDKIMLGLA